MRYLIFLSFYCLLSNIFLILYSNSYYRLIALGFDHFGVGSGVDDDISPNFTDDGAHGLGIGKIAARSVKGDDLAERSKRALKLKANLAIAAGKEDFHENKWGF
jgi:hypothetical protein